MADISHAARLYALRELSRRAGITNEFFQGWKIQFEGNALVVYPRPDESGRIRFPFFSAPPTQYKEVVKKTWCLGCPSIFKEVVPDFIVPFCRPDSASGQPLFLEQTSHEFCSTEDILASALLTLCRFEEVDSTSNDEHGRFPGSASIAFRHDFLHRPIVDEYGLALQQILQLLMPGWRPVPRSLRVKLSHDIDLIGIPFSLREALGHLLKRRTPLYFVRDILSLGTSTEPCYLSLVRSICRLSLERGIHSALYWKASPAGPHDSGYDLEDPRVTQVVNWATSHGIEMGVHPGYETFRSLPRLNQEVQRCRKVVRNERIGGRQHYLRWCPETWVDWERCGLAYDSSVGFADYVGFRAGTCIPYIPWLWKANRPAELLEIPLVVMDVTLVNYMKLDPEQSLSVVKGLIQRCAAMGGVFSLLWHNSSLVPPYARYYLPILNTLTGNPTYDWETDAKRLRSEVRQLHPQ